MSTDPLFIKRIFVQVKLLSRHLSNLKSPPPFWESLALILPFRELLIIRISHRITTDDGSPGRQDLGCLNFCLEPSG